MKNLFFIVFFALTFKSLPAFAAYVVCAHQTAVCDSQGNQYLCQVVAWTGPDPVTFCSPVDVTNRRRAPAPTTPPSEVSRQCMLQCAPNDSQCIENCLAIGDGW
jgi:hypothetical protein